MEIPFWPRIDPLLDPIEQALIVITSLRRGLIIIRQWVDECRRWLDHGIRLLGALEYNLIERFFRQQQDALPA